MNSPIRPALRRVALAVMAGKMFSTAYGQEVPGLPPGLGSILGITSSRLLEIREIAGQAERSGEWRQGMSALAAIARTSRETGDRPAWVEAELAWVKLASKEGEEPDLDDALEELVSRARDWGLVQQEAEVYTYWANRLESEGKWREALRALDGAAQATLGAGWSNEALRALLAMSRICRDNTHPWRLQQVWLRIGQLEKELPASINAATLASLDLEREKVSPMLDQVVPITAAPPQVDLQPKQTAVKVSGPHGEVGRARFFLTNETVHTVRGALEVNAASGVIKKWDSGRNGHWLTLGDKTAVPVAPKHSVSLRPGERVSIYMEREQPGTRDSVSLLWSGDGAATAGADFEFAPGQPETSLVNAGSFVSRPGWGVPFYHEFNYRGDGVKIEDFQFQASVPCRLEIFDVDGGSHPSIDAGTLLAIDAEGDGYFTGAGDQVLGDNNGDGNPDVLIGDRSRSLEIFAWPLVPLPAGSELTVSANLRRPEWRAAAEDALQVPAGKVTPATR